MVLVMAMVMAWAMVMVMVVVMVLVSHSIGDCCAGVVDECACGDEITLTLTLNPILTLTLILAPRVLCLVGTW